MRLDKPMAFGPLHRSRNVKEQVCQSLKGPWSRSVKTEPSGQGHALKQRFTLIPFVLADDMEDNLDFEVPAPVRIQLHKPFQA